MKTTAEEIERAMKALKNSNIVLKDGSYPANYNGYISSFGASLSQAGLLPTIIFFERKDSGAEEDRTKVVSALKMMMGIEGNQKMACYILEKQKENGLRHCDDPAFISDVVRNMVALKLALRMFVPKNEKNEQ